jgi:succinyl-CoA synthetase alpha subunit
MEKLKPDATGVYVAAHQAPAAIEEAIEAEVPLVVVVAEHIPIHDIMRVCKPFLRFGYGLTHYLDPFHTQDSVKV